MALKKQITDNVKTPWKSFPADVVRQSIQDFVHFSAKLTNSNSAAAGVRISANQRLDLPYLSVRTLGPEKVPLDYTKNVGSVATIAKKLKAVEQNEVDELYTDIQEQDISHFKKCIAVTITHHEIGTDEVGKRLRQVIVQDAEGKDVALTPLVSAGLTALLEKRIQQEIATRNPEEYRFRSRAFLPIGGSNPQNVGRFVRSLQHPLWFSAPEENIHLRQALTIHSRGISLQVSSQTLIEYDAWRRASLYLHGDMILRNIKSIESEVTYLKKMVGSLVQRARQAHQLLEKHLDDLPNGEMLANSVPPDIRAFIDARQRYAGWNRVLAKRIHIGLLEQKFKVDGINRNIGLGEQESERWVAIIEGFL